MRNSKFAKLAMILMCTVLISRAQDYYLTKSTETYTPISTGTSLNNGLIWDAPEYRIPIGFDFTLLGITADSLSTYQLFGPEVALITAVTSDRIVISAMDYVIIDRAYDPSNPAVGAPGSLSDISYKTSGNVGSRIFKIQWTNAGFFNELVDDGISKDYINVQLWIYEGTNVVEIKFGARSISQPAFCYEGASGPNPCIYRIDPSLTTGSKYMVSGNPVNPNLVYSLDVNMDAPLTKTVANGTVFRISPVKTSVIDVNSKNQVSIYPNPCNDILCLRLPERTAEVVEIWSAFGERVGEYAKSDELDVSFLSPGTYYVRVISADEVYSLPFSKL